MQTRAIRAVVLEGPGWRSPPIDLVTGFWARWRGLRRRDARSGLLLRARSVHGFGMHEPLLVIGLSAGGEVLGSRIMQPNRVVRVRRASWILELPWDHPPIDTGQRLEVLAAVS